MSQKFPRHVASGIWTFTPVYEALLMRVAARLSAALPEMFLRTGDAAHLTTTRELGEPEIWTNNRHMLAAAACFGLVGLSATVR